MPMVQLLWQKKACFEFHPWDYGVVTNRETNSRDTLYISWKLSFCWGCYLHCCLVRTYLTLFNGFCSRRTRVINASIPPRTCRNSVTTCWKFMATLESFSALRAQTRSSWSTIFSITTCDAIPQWSSLHACVGSDSLSNVTWGPTKLNAWKPLQWLLCIRLQSLCSGCNTSLELSGEIYTW